MKKFVALAAAALGLLSSLSASAAITDDLTGSWLIREENGQLQSDYVKNYYPNGQFTVEYLAKESVETPDENTKVTRRNPQVQQEGTWQVVGDTIIERCSKGDVQIAFTLNDGNLTQSFAYPDAPEVKYTQKLAKIGVLTAKQARPLRIDGVGTIYTDDDTVFILEGKHYTPETIKAALPAADKIERISAFKDLSVYELLTEEEIAAGKSTVIQITLK